MVCVLWLTSHLSWVYSCLSTGNSGHPGWEGQINESGWEKHPQNRKLILHEGLKWDDNMRSSSSGELESIENLTRQSKPEVVIDWALKSMEVEFSWNKVSDARVDICCQHDPILIYHICRKPSVESIFDKSQFLWRGFQAKTGILAQDAVLVPLQPL